MEHKNLNGFLKKLSREKYILTRKSRNFVSSTLYSNLDRFYHYFSQNSSSLNRVILIAGFWRSGTTWLQESVSQMLSANTVFEPFDPKVKDYVSTVVPTFLPNDQSINAYHMPFCSTNLRQANPILYQYLENCFTAKVAGHWIRTLRTSPLDSFRPFMTVKLVRAQLCLWSIYQEFSCPIIYITRDPRAVISSYQRKNWSSFFDSPFLEDTLLKPQDGRYHFFEKRKEEILRADRSTTLIRTVTFWALLERYVQDYFSLESDNICFLNYEKLVEGQYDDLINFLRKNDFNCSISDSSNPFLPDSKTTITSRKGLNSKDRIFSWKKDLQEDEIKQIESIVSYYDLEHYLKEE